MPHFQALCRSFAVWGLHGTGSTSIAPRIGGLRLFSGRWGVALSVVVFVVRGVLLFRSQSFIRQIQIAVDHGLRIGGLRWDRKFYSLGRFLWRIGHWRETTTCTSTKQAKQRTWISGSHRNTIHFAGQRLMSLSAKSELSLCRKFPFTNETRGGFPGPRTRAGRLAQVAIAELSSDNGPPGFLRFTRIATRGLVSAGQHCPALGNHSCQHACGSGHYRRRTRLRRRDPGNRARGHSLLLLT